MSLSLFAIFHFEHMVGEKNKGELNYKNEVNEEKGRRKSVERTFVNKNTVCTPGPRAESYPCI